MNEQARTQPFAGAAGKPRSFLPVFLAAAALSVAVITGIVWLGLSRVLDAELQRRMQAEAQRAADAVGAAFPSASLDRESAEWRERDFRVRALMDAHGLVRVRVFDGQGRLLYTSDESEVGRGAPMATELNASLGGSTATIIAAAHTVWRTPPSADYNQTLAATYVPTFLASERVKGSVEACANVTEEARAARATLKRSVGVVFGALTIAFLTLTAVMSRAQRTIVEGAQALGEARARSRAEEALRAVVEATAPATGVDFFRRAVETISGSVGARWAFVLARAESEGEPRLIAMHGEDEDSALSRAVCAACAESEGLGEAPGVLSRQGVAWARTLALRDSGGRVVGHMGAMHDGPIEPAAHHEPMLTILAARAGAELERLRAAEALERSRERLRVAERLASIGALAAGIGHDLNNLLLPMRGQIRSLLSRDADGASLSPGARAHAASLAQAVEFLRQLGENLRMLADGRADADRPGEPSASTRLHAWWAQVGPMLSRAAPRHAQVVASLPASLPPVGVAPARLTQATLNLIINAGDAIDGDRGGVIRVEGHEDKDGFVCVSVSDEGRGMPERVARLAFDPFFTTKPHGASTGLGLALVQQVATSCGGWADLSTREGEGTTIRMHLPIARSAAPGDAESLRVAVSVSDHRMAAYAGALLAAQGCHVSRHCGGEEAPECDVWLLDETAASAARVRRFLDARVGRRAVVLGAALPGWPVAGVAFVGETLDSDALRAALRAAEGARA